MQKIKSVYLYRFRDSIALNIPGAKDSFYLTPDMAATLAILLSQGACDIRKTDFCDSDFRSVTIDQEGILL